MYCKNCGSKLSVEEKFCRQCGSTAGDAAVHREIATSLNRVSTLKWLSRTILLSVLFAGLIYFFETIGRHFHPVIAKQPSIGYEISRDSKKIMSSTITAAIDGEYIVVPVENIISRRIVRFQDPTGKQEIPILAYVTPGGKIVTAMSLSESCRSTDFYLEGNTIHCANCPSYWNMESMEAYACCQKYYPDPIPSIVDNHMVKIDKNIIEQWRARL